ncbi:MAG: hypothetical protein IJI66_04300 [Erysipelotrichaceae bacterium]|nr:hypothetical protein [Erysipelotrichaceae bacterium]
MKKFLLSALLLLLIGSGIYYAAFHAGFYVKKESEPIRVSFSQGANLIIEDKQLEIKAVEVSSFVPGYHYADFKPEKEDYLRWFKQIHEMGANTILATSIMDTDFYNALYEFDQTDTLYLIQGLSVKDAIAHANSDAYTSTLVSELIEQGKKAVDIIHGNKDVFNFSNGEYGFYRSDVSDKVLAYLLLGEFDKDMVAYTDHSVNCPDSYEGRFFECKEGSNFESALANIMDEISVYEADKYGDLRLMGMRLDQDVDFVEYEEVYARQLNKYAFIDPENIISKDGASLFAAYQLGESGIDYENYEKGMLAKRLTENEERAFDKYTAMLNRHHSMPILAMYASSSAICPDTIGEEALSEKKQGEFLVKTYETIRKNNFAGAIISAWQDIYSRSSWNSAFAVDVSNSYLWHDLLNNAQNGGLMAFEPEDKLYHNGDLSGWKDGEKIIEGEYEVYVSYDYEGLNILVMGVNEEDYVYMPIDVLPDVGSEVFNYSSLSFDRKADFVLKIHGKDDTKLYVNDGYDATYENFAYEIYGINPFAKSNKKDHNSFSVYSIALANPLLVDDVNFETRILQRLGTYEAGELVHGNNDPNAQDFDSLSTFRFGDGYAQFSIPWLMLNMGDPANMRVHDDYYKYYGVELKAINRIYLGIGTAEDKISMNGFRVYSYDKVEYSERLKDSYEVLKGSWGEGS